MTNESNNEKKFVTRKLKWLEGVAVDPRLKHLSLAKSAAILIALRYLNNRRNDAFPGIANLMRDLGTDRRSTQRALDVLMKTKWLRQKVSGGRSGGRGEFLERRNIRHS
jgi:hypothetical protein